MGKQKSFQEISSEEKRLDVVVKFFHPVVAGIETNILNIYSYLAKQGWQVVIHTSMSTPDAPHSLPCKGEIQGLSIRRYRWHWYGFFPDIDWRRRGSICLHNFNVFPHSWMLLRMLLLRKLGLTRRAVFSYRMAAIRRDGGHLLDFRECQNDCIKNC